jgi:hypothetical protein
MTAKRTYADYLRDIVENSDKAMRFVRDVDIDGNRKMGAARGPEVGAAGGRMKPYSSLRPLFPSAAFFHLRPEFFVGDAACLFDAFVPFFNYRKQARVVGQDQAVQIIVILHRHEHRDRFAIFCNHNG